MNPEWHTYFRELRRSLKGYFWAPAVSLVFYFFNFPQLHGSHEHIRYLLIAFMYATVIYFVIWLLYATQFAILTHQHIQDGRPVQIKRPVQIFLSLAGTFLGLFIALYLDSYLSGEIFTFSRYWESLLLSLFIALMFQFYYAYKESSHENLSLKASKAEADLHVLRNQMQPHFLFNSLNSLLALIEQDPATAGKATQQLADLYRLILECSKEQLSPLSRELEIARLYLEIEKVRFGERLCFSLPAPLEALGAVKVPSLILQTLVENAVKHGISKSLAGGSVRILFQEAGPFLKIEVENSGAPLQLQRGKGTGLENTKERLTLAFGNEHQLSIASAGELGTRVSFFVPRQG